MAGIAVVTDIAGHRSRGAKHLERGGVESLRHQDFLTKKQEEPGAGGVARSVRRTVAAPE